jgi:hypothetical protein
MMAKTAVRSYRYAKIIRYHYAFDLKPDRPASSFLPVHPWLEKRLRGSSHTPANFFADLRRRSELIADRQTAIFSAAAPGAP